MDTTELIALTLEKLNKARTFEDGKKIIEEAIEAAYELGKEVMQENFIKD